MGNGKADESGRPRGRETPRVPRPPTLPLPTPPRPEEILPAALLGQLTLRQRRFLCGFAAWGTLTGAATASGQRRQSHSEWIAKSDAYRKAFAIVTDAFGDVVDDEIFRRAVIGWTEPVYQGGVLVGHKHVKSDEILKLLARGVRPEKYRERADLVVPPGGIPVTFQVTLYDAPRPGPAA